MANNIFQKKIVNRNVEIWLGRRYSPSQKDVVWLEDAQLIFLIFHNFVSDFFLATAATLPKRKDKLSVFLAKLHPSIKLAKDNFLPSIIYRFRSP